MFVSGWFSLQPRASPSQSAHCKRHLFFDGSLLEQQPGNKTWEHTIPPTLDWKSYLTLPIVRCPTGTPSATLR